MVLLSHPVPWLRGVVGRFLTAEARLQSEVSWCEFCGGQSDSGTGSSGSTSVFPCQYHPTNAPYSSSPHVSLTTMTQGEPWEPFKKQCSFGIGWQCIEHYNHSYNKTN